MIGVFQRYLLGFSFIGLTCLEGCVSIPRENVEQIDPYENLNRKIFDFNRTLDSYFLRPLAVGYNWAVPRLVRQGVSNVYSNLNDVNILANRFLQGNIRGVLCNLNRIVINSTFGLGGIFDVAAFWGLKKDHSDFGITLARWGSVNRPYLMLPFFGSATLNELMGKPVDSMLLGVWIWFPNDALVYGLTGGYYVQLRSGAVAGDSILDTAFDPYIFTRNAYLQRRQFLLDYDPYQKKEIDIQERQE